MADRYWVGGTASWDATAGTKWALTSGGAGGQDVPTAADDVYIDAGSGVVTVTVAAAAVCRNLSFTSGAGNFAGTFAGSSTLAISGDLTLVAGMTRTYTGAITFNSTTTQTITSNGTALNSAVTFNGVGGNWTIADDFVTGSIRTTTLTNGTLTLAANRRLSTGLFSADNNNVRAITFGSGSYFDITGTANAATINAWLVQNLTNMTYTGAPDVRLTGNSTANSRVISNGGTGGVTEAKAVSFTISAGSDTIINAANDAIKNLIFTSFTGTANNISRNLYGDLTLSSGMTFGGTAFVIMVATSGTQTVTTNGVTVDCPFRVNSPGATTVLADNFTQGSSRAFSILGGTLNINGKTLTVGTFSSSTVNARTLAFGTSGTINVVGSGASAWSAASGTLTMTGTGTISMTSASAKTFAGGGFNYAAALNQGGAGTLTVSGNNTFQNITNTYGATGATTITFTASSTQTVSAFTASGTQGNLLTLNSSSAGSQFTLSDSSGINSINYCSIRDCNATGGATWNAYPMSGNVDAGNNTGWIFLDPDRGGTAKLSVSTGLSIC